MQNFFQVSKFSDFYRITLSRVRHNHTISTSPSIWAPNEEQLVPFLITLVHVCWGWDVNAWPPASFVLLVLITCIINVINATATDYITMTVEKALHKLTWSKLLQDNFCNEDAVWTVEYIWATTRQNQQNGCAPSQDSDKPGHPPSLIRVFAVRSMGS